MIIYFVISFILSVIFAMAGTGSGIALIPILHFMGIGFDLAKVVGLMAGLVTTSTSSVLNYKRGVLDIYTAVPLIITLPLSAFIGAQLSKYIDQNAAKTLFAIFLIFSASIMLFFKKEAKVDYHNIWIMGSLGIAVGIVAGLLGIGGGNLLLPLLILFGFEPKKVAVAVSFVIPFTVIASLISYATFVQIDWSLAISSTIGAMLGAIVGNNILHTKLSQKGVKRVIAVLLYIIALKMLLGVFAKV